MNIDRAFDYCARHGYRVIRSGPVRINAVAVDSSRIKIIAEREKE